MYNYAGVFKVMNAVVYYSNTGGLFSKDIYTYNMKDFVKENIKVDDQDLKIFIAECNNVLRKINYLYILNHYQLYEKL